MPGENAAVVLRPGVQLNVTGELKRRTVASADFHQQQLCYVTRAMHQTLGSP